MEQKLLVQYGLGRDEYHCILCEQRLIMQIKLPILLMEFWELRYGFLKAKSYPKKINLYLLGLALDEKVIVGLNNSRIDPMKANKEV